MIAQLVFRFFVGGLFVTGFAILGSIFKPKSFSGLFGAAPSIGLATLVVTISREGRAFAATEARSMLGGAIAFILYAHLAMILLYRFKPSAKITTIALLLVWLVVALGLWLAFSRGVA
jgi:hypothetical protein